MEKIQFFIDFDGTVTQNDVIDMILERFADPSWKTIEEEWASGKIGSRECLTRQFELVKADKASLAKMLTEVRIDPGFEDFLNVIEEHHIPASIVSDGLDFVIQRVMGQTMPIYSNSILFTPQGPKISFYKKTPCKHGCANCKVDVIEKHRKSGHTTVFIGDGLSDRFAAHTADIVFAKKKLLKYCQENKIEHLEYSTFKEITKWLSANKENS